jgi:hypothetical protein
LRGTALSIRESTMEKPDFRKFYREAHAVTCLSDREKLLIGLAVAMTRNCETEATTKQALDLYC